MARHESEMHRQKRMLEAELADLAHLCGVLHNRYRAEMDISPAMWVALDRLTKQAKAVLQEVRSV